MRALLYAILTLLLLGASLRAQTERFIVDDDQYADKVVQGGLKLLHEGKLVSLEATRLHLHTRGAHLKFAPPSHEKMQAPDVCDRLRQSTFAVGTLYKCAECGEWHFNSSAGFAVAADGIVCTCCHVILAEDPQVKEGYLIASDAEGRVYPVRSVLAADTASDTCFLRLNASGLRPLPLRTGIRTGERVYCLSHPGGYYFMFTQGIIARINRRRNEILDANEQGTGEFTRPILFLNVTAEFAPGSSGAPIVDEAGNVVAQVASIADAGEPADDEHTTASPSVPIRFCTAAEEILRLTDPELKPAPSVAKPRPEPKPKKEIRKLQFGEVR